MKKIDQKSVELHARFTECGTNAKEWARRCMMLLPEIDKYKVWRKKGFGSLYEYAAKIAGLSRLQVNESLRVLSKIEDKPALMEVAREKGIWAVKPVATVATKETEKKWAERAGNMSIRELEVFVKGIRTESGRHVAFTQPEKISITMMLEPALLDQLKKLKGDGEWEDVVKQLLEVRKRELERSKPKPIKTDSPCVPVTMKRYINKRDNHRCVFPGCCRKAEELHHADGFARVKIHDPDRIFSLCGAHHDLAHRGFVENESGPPALWRVREKPDPTSPRFEIDRLVMQRRCSLNLQAPNCVAGDDWGNNQRNRVYDFD